MNTEIRFRISSFTPDTIPMARLAEYLKELAALLGHEKSVHLKAIEEGSAVLVHHVEEQDSQKVAEQVASISRGDANSKVLNAFHTLERLLHEDNGNAVLTTDGGDTILEFRGTAPEKMPSYGPITEEGSLDGTPIRIGGRRDMVTIELQGTGDGKPVHTCHASRALAKEISRYLFETPIRVHGEGRWTRTELGEWKLAAFQISGFVVLENSPLDRIVDELRSIPGNGWNAVVNPEAELNHIR